MFDWQTLIAVVTVTALATGSYRLGRNHWLFNQSPWIPATLMMATAASCCFVNSGLFWARSLPLVSVGIWVNLVPVMLLSIAAGAFSQSKDVSRLLRLPIVGSLLLSAGLILCLPFARPMFAPALVQSVGKTDGQIVLQSHRSSCAAAAAATLLRFNGIQSDERSMVKSCWTCESGTEALGLYRGLATGVQGSELRPSIADAQPANWLSSGQLPNVSIVYFPKNEYGQSLQSDQSLVESPSVSRPKWFTGRTGDAGHAVVVLAYEKGRWIVADPAVGLTSWSDAELKRRFTGDAIYLSR